MKLSEFSLLHENKKMETIWEGAFLSYRMIEEYTIILYRVYGFYVEVYYHNETNSILRIQSFLGKKRLEENFELHLN